MVAAHRRGHARRLAVARRGQLSRSGFIATPAPAAAGRGGGAITTDHHLKSPQGTPIANLWLSMIQVMGVKTSKLGDSTGALKLA